MDLMQLKMPPDRAKLVADAIERDLKTNHNHEEVDQLRQTLAWLRYRLARWENRQPDDTQD